MLYGQHINNRGRYHLSEPPTKVTTKQPSPAPGKALADAVTPHKAPPSARPPTELSRSSVHRKRERSTRGHQQPRKLAPPPPPHQVRARGPTKGTGVGGSSWDGGTPLYDNRSGLVVWVERTHLTAAACERAARSHDATCTGQGGSRRDTAATRRRRRRRGSRSEGRGRAGRETSRRRRRSHNTHAAGAAGPRPTCARHLGGCRCRPRRARGGVGGGGRVTLWVPTHPQARETRGAHQTRHTPGHSRHLHHANPPRPAQPTALHPLPTAKATNGEGPQPHPARDSWETVWRGIWCESRPIAGG